MTTWSNAFVTPKSRSIDPSLERIRLMPTSRPFCKCLLEVGNGQERNQTVSTVPPIRVKSIDHVTIVVKDLAASRRFYVDVLGMDEVARPGFAFAGQWFQAGPTLIHTILEFEGSSKAGWTACSNTRGHHFAFLVDDCHVAAKRIEEMGLPFVSPPKQRPDGAIQLFVNDPDGHLVELCSV